MDPESDENTRAVLGYFLRHPESADSVQGIARWRLLRETVDNRVRGIAAAIHALVEQGLLVEQSAPGVTPVYRLNLERVEDARRLLTHVANNKERAN